MGPKLARRAGASRLTRPLGVAFAVLLVGGCTGSGVAKPSGDPWAADFEAAYASAPNAYLKGILEDRKITPVEYEDSVRQYVACVNDAFPDLKPPPFTAERGANGLVSQYSFLGPTEIVRSQHADDVQTTCQEKFIGMAITLYEESQKNPEHLDGFEFTKKCLVAAGLVDDSYTEANLEADRYYDLPPDSSHSAEEPVPPREDATSFDAWSVEASKCG